jgi:hypothetical protein
MVAGCGLLVVGCWLLVVGCWLWNFNLQSAIRNRQPIAIGNLEFEHIPSVRHRAANEIVFERDLIGRREACNVGQWGS